jgi:N-acetylglucosamine-6-phosphate deacetylase
LAKATSHLAIRGGLCVTPFQEISDSLVLVEDGKIQWVGPQSAAEPEEGATILEASGMIVSPGFIDTHVHGSHGCDVMRDGADGIQRMAAHLLRSGTTSFCPTTVSARHDELRRAVECCREASRATGPRAHIAGIHVEGPYINLRKKGAQPPEGIRDPDLDECREYLALADGLLRIMTLAPEAPGAHALIRLLVEHGVIPSLGHSDADYDTAMGAIEAGATHATHLFNAMPPLHHRAPGLAAAALNSLEVQVELIADGIHVAPEMVRLAIRTKGTEGVVLITDSMEAVGMPDGEYTLGSHRVFVQGDRCTLADGTIASSMLTMNRAVRNTYDYTGCSLADTVRMATWVPAQAAGCAECKGTLKPGKDADIVLLNRDFTVAATILDGEVVYRAGNY